MKKLSVCFLAVFFWIPRVFPQVTPNSKRFEVRNYIAIDNTGRYFPYHTHGFVETTASGSTAKMFIMPLLEVDIKSVKFIDSEGYETNSYDTDVYSITIPIIANLSLPNESQKAAIGAALTSGSTLRFYYPPIVKNTFGGPIINPNAGVFASQIMALANQYEQYILQQQHYIDAYNQYAAQLISLSELEVTVKVGNDVVASERIPGTTVSMGGAFNSVSIDRPSQYIKNRIAGGNFSVLAKYKFLDTKGSYINARINASMIINQFLSEAQESTVTQKSSGWSFLGFGSRRKSMKSHFDQQVNNQFSDERFSNTTIEMYDADDDMIAMFENAFFPTISQQQAIQNHIAAAEKARLEGNTDLQKLHLDYVRALQYNDPNLEVNIGDAVAALGKKDYVGFIAHGVRWGDYRANGNNSFRRVLNSNEMTAMEAQWSQTKKISVQHAVSQNVAISQDVGVRAHLGLTDVIPYQGNMFISDGFSGQWRNIRGIILGPITAGGALHMNNITPGTLITSIEADDVYDGQSLTNALNSYDPGDTVTITIIDQIAQNVFQEKVVTVVLGSYPK
ncbi:hypothetical protein GCM10011386_02600 [Parapedobacter defluvii]|uniref:Uncharacterized protein n=1 Tax=Parapedobacter defluvii TaxID=2045106 RepID=A0ABQ1L097_9SPHI|nr:hypothetical protein [Parapedobacter defluvii]GGC14350.1 hypothetical protein GCM10011386_02600 [Parapedobacter defluvii]